MEKIQSNIEELRKIINEKTFDNKMAIEFLDAIEEEAKDYDSDKSDDLQNDLTKSEVRVDELLTEIEELKEAPTEFEIDCGIGKIEYNSDNLQLQQIMEALGERINKHGTLRVLQILGTPVTS